MLFMPLISAGIERLLNGALYREPALQAARQRLHGKILRLSLQEFSTPLVLVFSEQQLDVLNHWQDETDATVTTRLVVLAKLRDRQQLAGLIQSGDLQVKGDIRLVQHVAALLDLALSDPAHWIAYRTGDVAAQGITRLLSAGTGWIKRTANNTERYLAQALTEEWRLAPGQSEVNGFFAHETAELVRDCESLTRRLDKLEGK